MKFIIDSQIQNYIRDFLQQGPLRHEYEIQHFPRDVKKAWFAFSDENSLVPVDDDGYIMCNIGTFRYIKENSIYEIIDDELSNFSFIKNQENQENIVEEESFDFLKLLENL